MSARHLKLAGVLVLVAALAWIARDLDGLRRPFIADARLPATADVPVEARWFSRDPDGLYHTRRIARVLEEGLPVAETDPRLAFPRGAPIPWPPYYDLVCAGLLAPFAPDASREPEAFRAWLERAVATLPALFAVLSSLLAAGAAWCLVRGRLGSTDSPEASASDTPALAAALVAGITYACCWSSINYSVLGTGDHHAWISLLNGVLLVCVSGALAPLALASRRRALGFGVAAGVIAGVMLGSWVASLLYVLAVQLVLGWMIFRRAREEQPGLAVFGTAFHVVALLVLLPAVLSSPWRQEFPWMVVNLSWFHPLQLALGAAVFVPLLVWGRTRLAAGTASARRYPLLVAAVLAASAGVLQLIGTGPAAGIAEGFAWVSRVNSFMGTVLESAPLLASRAGGTAPGQQLFFALGYGVLLFPLAWFALARETVREHRDSWLPWMICTPILLAQALTQRRFGDALAIPMAVVLGYGVARLPLLRRSPAWLALPAVAFAALLLQGPAVSAAWQGLRLRRTLDMGSPFDHYLGDRMLYEWIRRHTPPDDEHSVLAHWDRGHMIEWAADRPSVATNFGSYVGAESYVAPSRFYLEEDPVRARAMLEQLRVRYVLAPGSLPANLWSMIQAVDPALQARYMPSGPTGGTGLNWTRTMGARLLAGGFQAVPVSVPSDQRSSPLGFLRLVHVSPWRDSRFPDPITKAPVSAGYVWEHVRGAGVAGTGAPDEELRLEFQVHYERANYTLGWVASARCDEYGVARLWVPYTTEGPNGDGQVRNARWSLGERGGALVIPEAAVLGGKPIVLR